MLLGQVLCFQHFSFRLLCCALVRNDPTLISLWSRVRVLMSLSVKTQAIYARHYYNRTGWRVEPGKRYALKATGQWIDLFIPSGPAGYASPSLLFYMSLLEPYRRVPEANWFALIGLIDSGNCSAEQHPVIIGEGLHHWRPARAGELVCYANDLPWLYWNNFGSVTLEIREL